MSTVENKNYDALAKDYASLLEAHEALIKIVPLITFNPKFETTDEDKKAAINKACEGAALLLRATFDMCELKTHIQTTVVFEELNESYKLSFIKV